MNLFNEPKVINFMGNKEEFEQVLAYVLQDFPTNKLCKRVMDGEFTTAEYHKLLVRLFHQVYFSSNTFALAASGIGLDREAARDYLIKHAEEEKGHWRWILNDLEKTNYTGPDPRSHHPSEPTQSYISFNFYVAAVAPIARLGIAAMLESLGATFGKQYITKFLESTGLKPNQGVFFFGHGDTDVGHTREIMEVIRSSNLSELEWGWMVHSALTGYKMYRRIFEESLL